jgi:hypothetical protein
LSEAGTEVRFTGGYNIFPRGRTSASAKVLPEPEVLYLGLHSGRFTFSELGVREGERVSGGDILAKDPDNYAVPLLAPRTGTVRLKSAEKVKLTNALGSKISRAEFEHIRRTFLESDALRKTEEAALQYAGYAKGRLSLLKDSDYKSSLSNLADYVIQRTF